MIGRVGALPSEFSGSELQYHALAKAAQLLPPPFSYEAVALRARSYPMFGNDQYGCCTFASIVRLMFNNAIRAGKFLDVDRKAVIDAYLSCTDGKDVGYQPIKALSYMRNIGVKDTKGVVHKIKAYARVNTRDFVEMESASASFGGLYVAAGLPAALDNDKDRRLELTPFNQRTQRDEPRSMGGHAYDSFGYDYAGETVVLWDVIMKETSPWTQYYREEAFVIIDEYSEKNDLLGIMQDQLAALKAA